jgi:hypothetical protein
VTEIQWFAMVKEGGAYVSPLLLGAIIWLSADRNRLLESLNAKDILLKEKDDKLASLSERTLVFMAEIKTFLFQGGRPA